MTADRDLDRRLASWFDERAVLHVPDGLLERSLGRVGATRQRPGWLIPDAWRSPRPAGRPATPARASRLLAVAAAVVLVAVGAGLVLRLSTPPIAAPSPGPSVSPGPSTSGAPSSSPNLTLRDGALIAFIRTTQKPNTGRNCGLDAAPTCGIPRLWVVGSDGSGAHELFPDGTGNQGFEGWSPDGTRLLYMENQKLLMTDASGADPRPVDLGCVAPCEGDSSAAFSNDGSHLVFVRNSTDASGYSGPSAIATLDLASGRIVELSPPSPVGGMTPVWSPDGKQIVFWRGGEKDTGGPVAPTKAAVFVVDADGQNLRQISPKTIAAEFAGWSPDGYRIVFTAVDAQTQDIYTVRPDGTDLRQLTTDGTSGGATWAPDGRILFVRRSSGAGNGGAPGLWTMDADGTNAAELVPGLMVGDEDPTWTHPPVWQPIGGPAIVPPPWNPSTVVSVGPPPPTPASTPLPALGPGFSWTGSLPAAEIGVTGDTATRLADGRVLVTIGCAANAELYDPTTGTFSQTSSMVASRGGATATLLRDGRVLIAGGVNCGDATFSTIWASAELYDPATNTFSPTGSMTEPRERHTSTLLADGRVLLTGGITGPNPVAALRVVLASYYGVITVESGSNALASAELYDPVTGTFSRTGSMSDSRDSHTATLLQDGRVLVVGGGGEGYASLPSAELYDVKTGTFRRTGAMASGRWLHSASLLADGRVLIAGGKAPDGTTYSSAEVYDPGPGKFSRIGSMNASRQQQIATLLGDGRVLVAGGYQYDGSRWNVLSAAELYDPGRGTFTPIGSIGEPRVGGTATSLLDGRVLIVAGYSIGNSGGFGLTSAVLYQP